MAENENTIPIKDWLAGISNQLRAGLTTFIEIVTEHGSTMPIRQMQDFSKAVACGAGTAGGKGLTVWEGAQVDLNELPQDRKEFVGAYLDNLMHLHAYMNTHQRGPGRPLMISNEPNTKRLQIRLPSEIWDLVEASGGAKFARKLIEEHFQK